MRAMMYVGTMIAVTSCATYPDGPTSPAPESDNPEHVWNTSDECPGGVAETLLPGPHRPDEVVALCSECDDGCDDLGRSCERYGDDCDFSGKPGVCVSCCDGAVGELRCSEL
jgi:hypothetical protein